MSTIWKFNLYTKCWSYSILFDILFRTKVWYNPGLIKYSITFDITAFIIPDTCPRSLMNTALKISRNWLITKTAISYCTVAWYCIYMWCPFTFSWKMSEIDISMPLLYFYDTLMIVLTKVFVLIKQPIPDVLAS